MTLHKSGVWLRPAERQDREFLFAVYVASRAEELAPVPWSDSEKAAFLRMQFDAQDAHYRQQYPGARFLVVKAGEVPIGRLYVARLDDEIRVMDIALLPEQRGRGIGTALLTGILAEADAARLPVTLHVEPWNRARRLYERLGFTSLGAGDVYEKMERQPSSQLKAAS